MTDAFPTSAVLDGGLATQLEAMGHDLSTVSRRVSHLEDHDLLERLPDPSDGRAHTVRLTDAGSVALADERHARTGLLGHIIGDWPEHDLVELDRLLARLSDGLAAEQPPSSSPQTSGRTSA